MNARKDNWPGLLAAFVEDKRAKPFDWTANNCGLFAGDWIERVTGTDPAHEYRKLTAAAAKKHEDTEDLAAKICAKHGWAPVALPYARRGDIVSVADAEGRPAIGVCLGDTACFAGPTGIAFRPLAECRKAWRIG